MLFTNSHNVKLDLQNLQVISKLNVKKLSEEMMAICI